MNITYEYYLYLVNFCNFVEHMLVDMTGSRLEYDLKRDNRNSVCSA